ncbi:MAG: hypothetical protein ACREDT_03790 [Methylocella sp.]
MLHFSRIALVIGAPLAIAALLSCVTPAGAKISSNGMSLNGTSLNKISSNGTNLQGISATAVAQNPASARSTTGSALGDLNGVEVEGVIIPDAAIR